jgi:hypothetical protein
MLMNMPILCRPRSAGIRHNIAQFCQAASVGGGQNTCAPDDSEVLAEPHWTAAVTVVDVILQR